MEGMGCNGASWVMGVTEVVLASKKRVRTGYVTLALGTKITDGKRMIYTCP